MPDIDFAKIRLFEGSQQAAFEEFCCQIARRAPDVPEGSEFIRYRGAGGDGGVECVWKLPDGQEWGWQAKYIPTLSLPQITKSVTTALELHPHLTRYTVCLPFNLTGPTGRGGKSESERYAEQEAKWRAEAAREGRHLEFARMGKSDLLDALLAFDPGHARLRFWFGDLNLSDTWFRSCLDDAIVRAGPRYTPKLSVEVPIAQSFMAFGRLHGWERSMDERIQTLEKLTSDWSGSMTERDWDGSAPNFPPEVQGAALALAQDATALVGAMRVATGTASNAQSNEVLVKTIWRCLDLAAQCESILVEHLDNAYGPGAWDNQSFRQFKLEYEMTSPTRHVDALRKLSAFLSELVEWAEGPGATLPSASAMVVVGPAGSGKTHAVCDAAVQRWERKIPSIVLFGEQFTDDEPWDQIRKSLGLEATVSRDALLGALNVAGECSGHPCVLFIDALNESRPRRMWRSHLPAMIEQVRRYPWVKLCVTCRTSYLEDTLPEEFDVPVVEHTGFAGVEFEACFEFFRFYGLDAPGMPLMQPEFSNPLFLRLVCESLRDSGVRRFPTGMLGLSEVVDYLLESKNAKAADVLDYHSRERLVHAALDRLVGEMVSTRETWLPWPKAKALADADRPSAPRSQSLFEFLLREGLLMEEQVADEDGHWVDAVRFGFERLTDYLVARGLLSDVQDGSVAGLFSTDGSLGHLVADRSAIRSHAGLLEALAILLPERYGVELCDVVSDTSLVHPLRRLVCQSLAWRTPKSVSERTGVIVRDLLAEPASFGLAFESLLDVATRPEHPLNALWTHEVLAGVPMADRDALLAVHLHLAFGRRSGVDRLIRWGLSAGPEIAAETADLWLTQLAWFCSAADRRVRDHATKAMVRLLEVRPECCLSLLARFLQVDDEYVTERCLASVYGALVRARRADALRDVADVLLERFFGAGSTPENAMVRDYARLLLEFALVGGVLPPDTDPDRFRPSYGSTWPSDWPGDEIDARFHGATGGYLRLFLSCTDDDFARYAMDNELGRYSGIDWPGAQRWIVRHVLEMGYAPERFGRYDGYMLAKYGGGRGKPAWAERIGKKYQWIALYRLVGRAADNLPRDRHTWDESDLGIPLLQAEGHRNIDPTTFVRQDHVDEDVVAWWVPIAYDFSSTAARSDTEWLRLKDFPDTERLLRLRRPSSGQPVLMLSTSVAWRATDKTEEGRSYPYRHLWLRAESLLVERATLTRYWPEFATKDWRADVLGFGEGLWRVFHSEYPWAVPAARALGQHYGERELGQDGCTGMPTTVEINSDFEYDAYKTGRATLVCPAPVFFRDSALHWDGVAGYVTGTGELIFDSPATREPGPAALLGDQAYLASFLGEHGYTLFWIVIGEKQIITGGPNQIGYTKYSRIHAFDGHDFRSSPSKTNLVLFE